MIGVGVGWVRGPGLPAASGSHPLTSGDDVCEFIMTVKSYQDLDVWQDAMALAEQAYALSKSFPPDERFGLTAQIRRASVSVSSCIAEGHARYSSRDFARFLAMAAGSVAEVETQFILASRLGFIQPSEIQPVIVRTQRIGRMLRGLRNSLASKLVSSDL